LAGYILYTNNKFAFLLIDVVQMFDKMVRKELDVAFSAAIL